MLGLVDVSCQGPPVSVFGISRQPGLSAAFARDYSADLKRLLLDLKRTRDYGLRPTPCSQAANRPSSSRCERVDLSVSGSKCVFSSRAGELDEPAARSTVELVAELRKAGRHVLSLYGSPHWLPPDHVLDAARSAVSDNDGAPAEGLHSLREAVARRMQRENGIVADPETDILVTNAANHALYVIFTSLLEPGDEVLLFSPHYYYQGCIYLAGGVPVYAQTHEQDGWTWDIDHLESLISSRTKILLVNTPVNPTGHVATAAELQAVADLAVRHDLLVLSDEAFDHVIYDDRAHLSIAAREGMSERAISVCSCTKSYALRHWRVGFIVGPKRLMPTFRKVLEWNVFNCNHVAQHAARAALDGPQDWVAEISARFQQCRDLMLESLSTSSGVTYTVPEGGPFLFLNTDGLAVSMEEFRDRLLREYGVPTDLGHAFGSDHHLRLSFGGEHEDVREAGYRITEAGVDATSPATRV
jgi:aspartate aminotransferase